MKMQITILTSALAIGWGVCVSAQADEFTSPLLGYFEAGVLCAQDSGVERVAPNTVAGTTHVVDEIPPFVSTGRVVPAVLGIGFGVVSGIDGGVDLDGVTFSVSHPPFAGSGATEQSFETIIRTADVPGITFYQFDHTYELALGEWTMRATSGAVTLYEVTFTVVHPTALPELAGVCGYTDLLSQFEFHAGDATTQHI